MLITEAEIAHVLETKYPGAKWWENFWLGYRTKPSNVQEDDAELLVWEVEGVEKPSVEEIQSLVTALRAAGGVPAVVPESVTSAQLGLALIEANLMGDVQALMDAPECPAAIRWSWDRASSWSRQGDLVSYIVAHGGISAATMDSLFVAAEKIVA